MKIAWIYRRTDLLRLIGTAAAYALLAKLVLTFYSLNGMVSVFWPGAGVSLAALLLGGRKFWLGIYIGSVIGGLWADQSLGEAALISIGSAMEALLGTWLLSRKGDFDTSLHTPRDFFRLCYLAGGLSPFICSLIGIGTLRYFGHIASAEIVRNFIYWWMGDTLGIVVVAPLVLVWRQLPRKQSWHFWEVISLFATSFLIGQIVFLDWFREELGPINRGFWLYPVCCWAAVRLGLHGLLLILLLITGQALVGSALGAGTYGYDPVYAQLVNFWAHTMILTVISISLAIIFAERVRITAELHSSERTFRSLFENMQDGLAHCRMIFREGIPIDYEYIQVNPAFDTISGLKDVIGRKISEIIPDYARDNQITLDTFARVVQTGTPVHCEHYFAARDRWFSFSVYRPAESEFICLIENITERKLAEEELCKLSLAIEQCPVSIVITDLEARIQYVNPAFTVASGYSAEEVIGQNPRLLQSGYTSQSIYKQLWNTLLAGKVWRGEFINRRKGCAFEYFEAATIAPLRQADGRITHYVAIKEDITERKKMLINLRSSEERLRLAKTAAGLGIYDFDIVSGLFDCDEWACELWGIKTDEPITYAIFMEGVHPDDRAATQAAINQAIDPSGTGEYYTEYRVISRTDGRVRHVAANGQAFFENGRAFRFVGSVRDISKLKQQEKEMQEQRNEMGVLVNQQVAAQTAAAIAHEMNQPLVAISAYSEAALNMLHSKKHDPEKFARALEGAALQSQRAGNTLHELLNFLHKGEAEVGPVDLNSVVNDALVIAKESGYGGFQQVLQLEPDLPPVQANRVQLQKVLVNLLHNGVEAMRGAGVAITAITIRVQTLAEKNMAQVTIQDSGPGFDEEIQHRIFDPFFTTKPAGIGLGLAISRALIETHGGQLWADPDAGPGATFHFVLPFAP
ncbi:MAG: PAS domain S-box protein [Formivibrio sp.]|nr:PAS domain S-box protein [Formivibrio sp.]